MATSLLKFSFKTGLIKSVISEIASNISKYYYTFGKANPWFSISGVTATVVANSNTVILTSGTTTGFKPGQLVTQTSGVGRLSANAKVESIVSSTSPLEASLNSFTPFPSPRINSGIFLPPKSNKTRTKRMIISWPPRKDNK